MFGDDLPDLAVRGETGIDIFHRQDLPAQRRSRFRCLGTVRTDGTALPHEPDADAARLRRAAAGLAAIPVDLADATGFPRAGDAADPIALFQRIDFLRAFALADLALGRFMAALGRDARGELANPGPFVAQVGAAYGFNRIGLGVRMARLVLPALPPPAACGEDHAFGLRMLGDLALRGDEAATALACFEAALAIGVNPHRRARALAAAHALGDGAAIARHSGAAA